MSRPIRLIVNAVPLTCISTGIGRYMRSLYQALGERFGRELAIGYFDGARVSAEPPCAPSDPARWSRLSRLFWRLPPRAALLARLAVQVRRELAFRRASRGFDLYHEAAFFPFRGAAGLKKVFTIHDLSLIRHPEWHPRERVAYSDLFFRRRLAGVDRFLAVSAFTRGEAVSLLGLPAERIAVTPLACDPGTFRPRSRSEADGARLRHGLPERYFLFVGTNDPRKNLGCIPPAIAAAGLDAELAVAGWSGWGRAGGKGMRVLGYVGDDELACLYSGALALVFVSSYEGFGLPVLEAMACGCPVVCSRAASLPEVAGGAALYVDDPTDTAGLAAALGRVAGDPGYRDELAAAGRERAARFSWERTARASLDTFRHALGRS